MEKPRRRHCRKPVTKNPRIPADMLKKKPSRTSGLLSVSSSIIKRNRYIAQQAAINGQDNKTKRKKKQQQQQQRGDKTHQSMKIET
jgi:hypothetical protein